MRRWFGRFNFSPDTFHPAEDVADVVAETDVEHAVDFVQNHEADVLEADDAAVEKVDHAAGGADQHLGAVLEMLHLRDDFLSAEHGRDADRCELRQPFQLFFHLLGQLTGRHENDRLRGQSLGGHLQNRDAERRGLAGAGAGLPEDVDPGERARNQQRLDFRRCVTKLATASARRIEGRTPRAANASGNGGWSVLSLTACENPSGWGVVGYWHGRAGMAHAQANDPASTDGIQANHGDYKI